MSLKQKPFSFRGVLLTASFFLAFLSFFVLARPTNADVEGCATGRDNYNGGPTFCGPNFECGGFTYQTCLDSSCGSGQVAACQDVSYQYCGSDFCGAIQRCTCVAGPPPPPSVQPPVASLSASPSSGTYPYSSTLSWSCSNGGTVATFGGPFGFSPSGSGGSQNVTVDSFGDHFFDIACLNSAGTGTASTAVSATSPISPPPQPTPPSVTCSGPTSGQTGQTLSFSATKSGGTGSAVNWFRDGSSGGSGNSYSTSFSTAGVHTVVAVYESVSSACDMYITAPITPPPAGPPAPTLTITANPNPVNAASGYNSSVGWTSTDATSCSLNGGAWNGTSGSGYNTGALSSAITISGTCTGPGGTGTGSVTITVSLPPPFVTCSGPTSGQTGQTLSFSATKSGGTGSAVNWFRDGSSGGSGNSYSTSFSTTGIHTVVAVYESVSSACDINISPPPPPPPTQSPPTATLTATPGSGTVTFSSSLSWSCSNGSTISTYGGGNGFAPSGSGSSQTLTFSSSGTYTFDITCMNSAGVATASASVMASNPAQPLPTLTITANPTSVLVGGHSLVSWSSTNATSCSLNGGSWGGTGGTNYDTGALNTPGSITISGACAGLGGTCGNMATSSGCDSETITVNALPPPPPPAAIHMSVSLSATSPVNNGQTSSLNWTTLNAQSPMECHSGGGPWSMSGGGVTGYATSSTLLNSGSPYTFVVVCTDQDDVVSASDSVSVNPPPPPPPPAGVAPTVSLNISLNPATALSPNNITVSWGAVSGTAPITCGASGSWGGAKSSSGGGETFNSQPAGFYSYTLACTNSFGASSDTVSATITNPPTPPPPPPPPVGAPSCSASPSSVAIGETAGLSASGGNNTYAWSAPGGNLGSGSGSGSSVSYNTSGLKTVTVTSAGLSGNCSVDVVAGPNIFLDANPSSGTSPLNSSVLTWGPVSGSGPIASCSGSGTGFSTGGASSGADTVGPFTTGTYNYSVTCLSTMSYYAPVSVPVSITVSSLPPPPPPPAPVTSVNLSVSSNSVAWGGSVNLTWTSTNTSSCSSGDFPASGANSSSPVNSGSLTTNPTTFTLVCLESGTGNQVYDTETVTVGNPPAGTPKAKLEVQVAGSASWSKTVTVTPGTVLNYQWSSENGTAFSSTYSVNPAVRYCDTVVPGGVPPSGAWVAGTSAGQSLGAVVKACQASKIFTIEYFVTGGGLTVSDYITVIVVPPVTTTWDLAVDTHSVPYGGSVNLTWTSTNTSQCYASTTSYPFATNGATNSSSPVNSGPLLTPSPPTVQFGITCFESGTGTVLNDSEFVTVGAMPPPPPPPVTIGSTQPNLDITAVRGIPLCYSAISDNDAKVGGDPDNGCPQSVMPIYDGDAIQLKLNFHNNGTSSYTEPFDVRMTVRNLTAATGTWSVVPVCSSSCGVGGVTVSGSNPYVLDFSVTPKGAGLVAGATWSFNLEAKTLAPNATGGAYRFQAEAWINYPDIGLQCVDDPAVPCDRRTPAILVLRGATAPDIKETR